MAITPISQPSAAAVILVVDDDPSARRLICTVLTEARFRVHECDNAKKALTITAIGSPEIHLALLNLDQEVAALDLARTIHQHLPQIPEIIMASAPVGLNMADHYIHIIAKPFVPGELVNVIHELIRPGSTSKRKISSETHG